MSEPLEVPLNRNEAPSLAPPEDLARRVQEVLAASTPSKWGRWSKWAIAVVFLGLVGFGTALHRPAPPGFRSVPVSRGDVQLTVTASGKLQGLSSVDVGAEITGKVLRVSPTFNQQVTKGEVLAEIDPEQLKGDAAVARAQVAVAKAAVEQAAATLEESSLSEDRARAQSDRGLISKQALESARATRARAVASLASSQASALLAEATLRSAEWKLAKAVIRSPIDGVVLNRTVEPGQTVTAGYQTPVLFTLAADLARLSLRVDVDEADVGHAREGMEASFSVDAFPGEVFRSRVLSVHYQPKTTSNVVSYEAELAVDNSRRLLRPGMTATASIVSEVHHDVLLVPDSALRFTPPAPEAPSGPPGFLPGLLGPRGGLPTPPPDMPPPEKQVWVLDDGRPTPIPVEVGLDDGHRVEIRSARLQAGRAVLVGVLERP